MRLFGKNQHDLKYKTYCYEEFAMRGEIISREYQRIEWVRGEDGKEYACYRDDGQTDGTKAADQRSDCLDLSQVIGDSW